MEKYVAVAAIEDDAIFLAATVFEYRDGQYRYSAGPKVQRQTRKIASAAGGEWGAGELYDRLFTPIGRFVKGLDRPVDAFGISSFGNSDSPGRLITNMASSAAIQRELIPFNVDEALQRHVGYKPKDVILENDATAAALGEYIWGAGQGSQAFAYVWAGLGTNVGLVLKRDAWKGLQHPELGHFYPRIHKSEKFRGSCPEHIDCLQGLVGLRSVEIRLADEKRGGLGMEPSLVSEIIGYYYAQLCFTTMLAIAVDRIVIGGLLLKRNILPGLLASIRFSFSALIRNYPSYSSLNEVTSFILGAEREDDASLSGILESVRRQLSLKVILSEIER